jgi:FkbM family methyltransferase
VWEGQEVQSIIWSLADAERQGIKDPVLLDIGANLGVFALTAAALGYEVIAFEAMERNQKAMYSSLCASPALQERITLFPFALGAEEATCSVISDKANVADGHVACAESTRQSLLMEGYVERGKMHVVTLGDYMDGVDVHVLKVCLSR